MNRIRNVKAIPFLERKKGTELRSGIVGFLGWVVGAFEQKIDGGCQEQEAADAGNHPARDSEDVFVGLRENCQDNSDSSRVFVGEVF